LAFLELESPDLFFSRIRPLASLDCEDIAPPDERPVHPPELVRSEESRVSFGHIGLQDGPDGCCAQGLYPDPLSLLKYRLVAGVVFGGYPLAGS